jgi:hypothetical protein
MSFSVAKPNFCVYDRNYIIEWLIQNQQLEWNSDQLDKFNVLVLNEIVVKGD